MSICEHGLFGRPGFGIITRCCSRCQGRNVEASVALTHIWSRRTTIVATDDVYDSVASDESWTPLDTIPMPLLASMGADAALKKIRFEIDKWELGPEQHQRIFEVSRYLMEIVRQGGAGLIVQSNDCHRASDFELTDRRYLLSYLQNDTKFSRLTCGTKDDFAKSYKLFTKPAANDQWNRDAPTPDGRNKRQDSGFVFKGEGRLMTAAATLTPKASAGHSAWEWEGHGSRHKTALRVASALRRGIVYVKGSDDKMHVLTASDARNGAIFHVEMEVKRRSFCRHSAQHV